MTIFRRNYEEAMRFRQKLQKAFNEKGENPMSRIPNLFVKKNTLLREDGYVAESTTGKKIAIVILAISGCGKTTLARKIISENPEFGFELCSMDEMSLEQQLETGIYMKEGSPYDTFQAENFGKKLRAFAMAEKNIICDGLYANIFTRAALLKTLHEFGYEIQIIFIKDMLERMKICTVYRTLDILCSQVLLTELVSEIKNPTKQDLMSLMKQDPKKIYCKKHGVSEEYLLHHFKEQPQFFETMKRLYIEQSEQYYMNAVEEQVKNDMIKLGADVLYMFEQKMRL